MVFLALSAPFMSHDSAILLVCFSIIVLGALLTHRLNRRGSIGNLVQAGYLILSGFVNLLQDGARFSSLPLFGFSVMSIGLYSWGCRIERQRAQLNALNKDTDA
jgi:hypothetical protein